MFEKNVLEVNKAYYYINREVAKDIFGDDFLEEFGSIYYSGTVGLGTIPENVNLSPEEKMFGEKIISEGHVNNFPFRGLVILKLLTENGKLPDCQFFIKRITAEKEVVPEDVGKKILAIDDVKFESKLTENDVKRLIEIHKNIKNRFIKTLIDIFKNPDNHQFKNKDGKAVQIKQIFRL